MPRLMAFDNVTLDGRFAGPNGDLGWAHKDDPEWKAFVDSNASGDGRLVFGRVTYQMMASYWPTPLAHQTSPVVAERMSAMPKIVFSRTLSHTTWENTTLINDDLLSAVRRLKREPGEDMAILGSGSIVAQLTAARLIDEYQIVINPLVIGEGKALFEGVKDPVPLRLTKTRPFENGNVLLCYAPA